LFRNREKPLHFEQFFATFGDDTAVHIARRAAELQRLHVEREWRHARATA
jgi:hypothetical protein